MKTIATIITFCLSFNLFGQKLDSVYVVNKNGIIVLILFKNNKPLNTTEAEKLKEAKKRDEIKIEKKISISDYDTSKIRFELYTNGLRAYNPNNLNDTISVLYFKSIFYYPEIRTCDNNGSFFSIAFKAILNSIDEKYFDGKKTIFKIFNVIVKLPNGKTTVLKREIFYPQTPIKKVNSMW